ncbi:ABC transporter permease [Aureibaculum sp. 2210JD6-5]|uniref:ABC transporter permease n=1 Tax=Aureibaculum sp. 2210JD6-5 TaxID=3103957 RepID=UPI002AAD6ED7|nr:ABC transporter permease [Aureibaculum sp. 2210JD6-5]MDY7393811.1 ABC transporter permease [Aureibaculum sp. 2210JD6-5]
MFDIDRWREIFQSINKNKLRTFLGAFTVALGIFIFTVLFGMGNGLKNTFDKFFSDDATNTIFISPGNTSKAYKGFKEGRRIQFENEDLELLEKELGDRIEYLSARVYKGVQARNKNESGAYTIRSVHPDHQFIENTIITSGRFIDGNDIRNKTRVVVIGRLVEEDLFKKENALGKFLELNGITYKVVGIFKDEGSDEEERNIYAPVSTIQLIHKNTNDIDQIVLTFNKALGVSGAKKVVVDITRILKEKHFIAQDDRSGIFVRSVFDNYQQNMQLANVLQMIVLWIGIGTLFAGAISIGNIMVFVVKERTKELGIRKALGATPGSIVGLILQESIFITAIAGYIGILIAIFALSRMGNNLEDYFITNPQVNTSTIVWATVILIFVGALAGYIPARRAAKIKPVVALSDD